MLRLIRDRSGITLGRKLGAARGLVQVRASKGANGAQAGRTAPTDPGTRRRVTKRLVVEDFLP